MILTEWKTVADVGHITGSELLMGTLIIQLLAWLFGFLMTIGLGLWRDVRFAWWKIAEWHHDGPSAGDCRGAPAWREVAMNDRRRGALIGLAARQQHGAGPGR